MATHSSVLAWRIPGTAEPGGLPSIGSHRVGHDWSDLAAAANIQYRIINYSHHAVCYIPWTYLSYNWKLVPVDHLAPFTCYLPLTTTKVFSVSMSSIFVHCFLDSTDKWDCMVFVFLCLTYFTMGFSRQEYWSGVPLPGGNSTFNLIIPYSC